MAKSMTAQLQTSDRQTSTDLRNVTFSQALADGLTHSDWLVGPKTVRSGQARVLASHSVSPEKAKEQTMIDTFGPLFGGSSPSADLQHALANRLRQRMAAYGSPEYDLTWKQWDMLSGPPICALRGSVRRTSGNGCGGWPTLTVQDAHGRDRFNQRDGSIKLSLLGLARVYPTITRRDGRTLKGGVDRPNRTGGKSLLQTMLDDGEDSGRLNPIWCAWFMGYPQKWVPQSVVLEMPSSRN